MTAKLSMIKLAIEYNGQRIYPIFNIEKSARQIGKMLINFIAARKKADQFLICEKRLG